MKQTLLPDHNKFYTATIFLLYETEDKRKALTYYNIPGNLVQTFQAAVWNRGVMWVYETGMIELVNPFKIDKVLFLPQEKKLQ